MSHNHHGMPSRVPAIAALGRLFADPSVPAADKQQALDVLVQDHADLDEVEAQAALWAISELGPSDAARHALLTCASAWLTTADTAQLFLDCYHHVVGTTLAAGAAPAFAQLQGLALRDADLAARLQAFAPH